MSVEKKNSKQKKKNIKIVDAVWVDESQEEMTSSLVKDDAIYDESAFETSWEEVGAESEPDADIIVMPEDIGEENFLPVVAPERFLVPQEFPGEDNFRRYLREIARYPLLSKEREQFLIKQLTETGDIDVAKELVRSNLRLVVKIAMEYRNAYSNVMDLIQEGNIGLMKAVSRYDPEKGAKLSYYASWWIKSYILKFILDNFRLVKVGTTQEQKKLFYNLMKEKERLQKMGINPNVKLISSNLGVSEKAVVEMEQRLGEGSSDLSLEYNSDDEEDGASLLNILANEGRSPESELEESWDVGVLKENLANFLATLKERDRQVFEKRLLSEVPETLQSIAEEYGVTRERIRQIEDRLLKKLKVYMSEFIR